MIALSPNCANQLETRLQEMPICMNDKACEFQKKYIENNVFPTYCGRRLFIEELKSILHEDLR